MFLSILGPKMAPRPKGILIIFGYFLDIFRHFSLSRLFQRFWLISHAQDDQEQPKSMENSMEKDDQNPSQGLPKGSKSPLYGRAVAPALPAQFVIPLGKSLEENRGRGHLPSTIKSAESSWTPPGSPKPPLGRTTRTLGLSRDRFESFGVHFGELIHEEIHLKTLSLWNAFCQALRVISGSESSRKST